MGVGRPCSDLVLARAVQWSSLIAEVAGGRPGSCLAGLRDWIASPALAQEDGTHVPPPGPPFILLLLSLASLFIMVGVLFSKPIYFGLFHIFIGEGFIGSIPERMRLLAVNFFREQVLTQFAAVGLSG